MTFPTTLAEAIDFYPRLGLAVTPVAHGDKEGRLKGWSKPNHSAAPNDFRVNDNIGVLNGTQAEEGWFFHDVDIDANSDGARRIVERLCPPTGWRYGRASKPRSHANYLVRGQCLTRRYSGAGVERKAILELRGVTKKGTHTLSVAPGSVHETGEPIRFSEGGGGAIGRVDNPADLERAVQHAAVGIVIYEAWPANSRHRLRLAFAKILDGHGLTADESVSILEAVMDATGSDIADVASAVRDTVAALRRGDATEGASAINDVRGDDVGEAVIKAIERILRSSSVVDEKTDIVMHGGALSSIVNRAEEALRTTSIYQRGGVLVRSITLDRAVGVGSDDAGDVRRPVGATVLLSVRAPWLLEQMGRVLKWRTAGKGFPLADPKPLYALTLLGRAEWSFPVLRGIVTAPTLAADGRIIETSGYDASSGLLVDITPGAFPPVPHSPTREDAMEALRRLEAPLRGFPFVDDAARSVALSALLTALVRVVLRPCPLHGFDAPIAGSGKSMLAEIAGLLLTGVKPAAMSQGKTDEEDEKRLSTVLFAGDTVIHIDNCERPVSGAFLCSMLTLETVQARILGQSERRILPSTALVMASGNNLTFAGDTSRRAVVCRLDHKVERPDTLPFDFDCHDEVIASRPELVVSGLTVLRAYHLAGRPIRLTPMGSFSDYEWIRGALVWLDRADPADTRLAVLDNDPRKDELLHVLTLWSAELGSRPVELKEIGDASGTDLHAALIEAACHGRDWNAKSVGWWLRKYKDRVVGGRSLRSQPGRNGQQWMVIDGAQPNRLPFIPDGREP